MSRHPLRRCLTCNTLTPNTRCEQHDLRRHGATARGYGPAYVTARRHLLADQPPCWKCGALATTADHVPPLRAFTSPAAWVGELRPACLRCNSSWRS